MSNALAGKKLVAAKYDINVSNSLYSSVLGLVRGYVQGLFPPDFFKNVYIRNSSVAVVTAKEDDDQRIMIDKPNLSLFMNYEPGQASFNGDPFIFGNMMVLREAHGYRNIYNRIAWDNQEMIYISALESKAKHTFEITVQLNTEMQCINVLGYLKAKCGIERPFFLNSRYIEVPIPPSLIGAIAAAKEFTLATTDEMLAFNNLLNKISDGRITSKRHDGSGKFAYFYKYATNLLVKAVNYDNIDKVMDGKSENYATVKFSLEVEYGTHVNFIAESYQNLPPPVFGDFILDDIGFGAIMHWTINLPVTEQLEDGRKCVLRAEIVTEPNETVDSTEFKPLIHSQVIKYIEHLRLTSEDEIRVKFKPILYRDARLLEEGIDYEVDWTSYTLIILNPFINYDYRFFLYAPVNELNAYIDSIQKPNNI